VTVRLVQREDKAFWYSLDRHLPEAEFDKKVRDGMGYVLWEEDTPIGILRWNLFWDQIPFCTLLYIREDLQKQGCGRALMRFWEAAMRAEGHDMVMVSTQSDEDAQHFYRKLGYQDAGSLILNAIPRYAQAAELFLIKDIR